MPEKEPPRLFDYECARCQTAFSGLEYLLIQCPLCGEAKVFFEIEITEAGAHRKAPIYAD